MIFYHWKEPEYYSLYLQKPLDSVFPDKYSYSIRFRPEDIHNIDLHYPCKIVSQY